MGWISAEKGCLGYQMSPGARRSSASKIQSPCKAVQANSNLCEVYQQRVLSMKRPRNTLSDGGCHQQAWIKLVETALRIDHLFDGPSVGPKRVHVTKHQLFMSAGGCR